MTEEAWRQIGAGDPGEGILAVDFDSTARAEAGFAAFSRLLSPAREIWLTSQPEEAERELVGAEAYLRRWLERRPGAEGTVHAVMGYCVGSVFAAALADEIAAEQGTRPRLLLIDPEPVDMLSPYRDFAKAVAGMTVLNGEERDLWTRDALAVCRGADEDFHAAVTGVVKLYEDASGLAFERLGLDEETGEELRGLFRSYLSYLHAARQLRPQETWATAVALTSAHSAPGAVHACEEQRFDITTAQMLNDPSVAEAARNFLEESAA